MSRLPTSSDHSRTLPKPGLTGGSRIQLQRTNLASPKKQNPTSKSQPATNGTSEKKDTRSTVSGLKPPSGISKIGKPSIQYNLYYSSININD